MKLLLYSLVLASLATPLSAQTIDVNQPINVSCMAGLGPVDLAQSFIPTVSSCSGAGVFMSAGVGSAETLTIGLYENGLPGQGGTLIAAGTGLVSPGVWTDLFWPAVPVNPGSTYYLDLSPTAGMCYAGSTSNPYAGGQMYANAGYVSFPSFDYAFRTYTESGPMLTITGTCPNLVLNIADATPSSLIAFVSGRSAASFVVPNGACAGTILGVSPPVVRVVVSTFPSGRISIAVNPPPVACGTLFLQAVEVGSCGTSNVVALI